MDVKAEQEKIRTGLVVLFLGTLLLGLYWVFEPFLVPLVWAIIIVLSTWPLYRWIFGTIPRHPGRAAFLMTSFVALLIVLVVVPLMASLVAETQTALRGYELWLEEGREDLLRTLFRFPVVGSSLKEYYRYLQSRGISVLEALGAYQPELLGVATSAAKGVFTWFFHFAVCLLAIYYLYRHGLVLGRGLAQMADKVGGEAFGELLFSVRQTVRAAMHGTLVTAVVQGVLAGFGFFVFGAPVPVLLGFVTAVISLVPMGPPLVYLPVAIAMFMNGAYYRGILIAAWGIGVVSTADNIVRPLFLSHATRISFFLVFIGIVGGLAAFGFKGIFLGPVVIAVVQALLTRYLLSPDQVLLVTHDTPLDRSPETAGNGDVTD